MGMPIERAENLMVYMPQGAAIKLVAAQNTLQEEVAMLESEVFLNANRLDIWLTEEVQPTENQVTKSKPETVTSEAAPAIQTIALEHDAKAPPPSAIAEPEPAPKPISASPPATMRDISPEALAAIASSIKSVNDQIVKELEPQAHLVAYAPPAVIAFRNQAYLELSVNIAIAEPPGTSRYKLAALAFDDHISPLIRRVLAHFPGDQPFDGISFSATVHRTGKTGVPQSAPLSVEFFFPLKDLRRYESYDCTSQQLLEVGTVLINGERVTLDLQLAEGLGRP
jgi:hypothetical protein